MYMKLRKEVWSLMVAVVLFCVACASAYAAGNPNDKVVGPLLMDTSHPYAFFAGAKTVNGEVLTVYYGNASLPAVGNPVITEKWKNTQAASNQWFERVSFVSNGAQGEAWSAYADSNLVLNARRTTSTPEVNIARAIGNYFGDINIIFDENATNGSTMSVVQRGNVQKGPRYIKRVSAMSQTQHYTNWNTTGTKFFMYDVGGGGFV